VIEKIQHLNQADLQRKGVDYAATPEGQILKELIFKLTSCTPTLSWQTH
jgi:hypothetical protein